MGPIAVFIAKIDEYNEKLNLHDFIFVLFDPGGYRGHLGATQTSPGVNNEIVVNRRQIKTLFLSGYIFYGVNIYLLYSPN